MGEHVATAAEEAKTDRITNLDGTLIGTEGITPKDASRKHRELGEAGVEHLWDRWCGERAGWNNVGGYHRPKPAEPKAVRAGAAA